MRVAYKEFAVNCNRLVIKDKSKEQLMEEIELLRKEVEALRESNGKNRTLVEASRDAIVEIDEKGRITLWNRGAKQIFGYSTKEILGQPVTKLLAGKYRERHRRRLESSLSENRRLTKFVDGEGLRKDGSRFPIEWSLCSWKENGRTMFAAIGKDITERTKAESTRKQAEELYTTFANSAQTGVYIAEDGRFQFVNPQFQSFTGFSRDELLGIDSLTIVHPEDRETVRENAVKMLKGERSSPYEFRAISKGGETRWVMETVTSIQYRGKRATLGNYLDITEHKKAEEQLKHSFINLAETISRAVESRDPYTAGHQWRVAELARLVGEKMGLDSDTLQGLYIGGLLHDIGKISTPESILSKPGELTEEEWGLIRAHTKQGYKILRDTALPWPVTDMAVHHHERLDGSGYPHGISGDKLSLEVRILAVCDVAEAMNSHRPYRPARSKEEVVEEIKDGRGMKYDTEVVDTVLQIIENGGFEFGWRAEAQLARV